MPNNNNIKAAEIQFFGPVEEGGFWGGISSEDFARELARVDGEDLEIVMNSPGGDVFEGVAIANLIARRNGKTTLTVIGLAASIAADIAMSADVIQMADNSMMMIHNSGSGLFGNAEDLRKRADLLDQIDGIQANIFVNRIERSGKLIGGDKEETRKKVEEMLDAETWLTASEALELGLIDKIVESRKNDEEDQVFIPGQAPSDSARAALNGKIYARLSSYRNTPKEILAKYNIKTSDKMDANDTKGFFTKLAAFFGFKATIEEQTEPEVVEPQNEADNNQEPTQIEEEMTNEEMLAKLKEAGYTIEEPKTEEVEPQKEEKSEPLELAAMRKKMEEMEASLKDMKLKAATMPSGASDQPQAKKEDKNKINLSADNKKSFENLAALVREL